MQAPSKYPAVLGLDREEMSYPETGKCFLCDGEYHHYGNNPEQLGAFECRVCDNCNLKFVIPARIARSQAEAEGE
jgi:hypothetical protein